MFRIITTFNDQLYRASGRSLLEGIARHAPSAEVLVYEELESESVPVPTVSIAALPEFRQVAADNADIISPDGAGLDPYNRRWFGWFRKVVAQHDAMTRRPFNGYTLFLDSDIRIRRGFDERMIRRTLHRAVGVFKGVRESIESGVILYDGRNPLAGRFAGIFMDEFLSRRFRGMRIWADNYVMTACMAALPEAVQDLAEGLVPVTHRNSNGHETGGQVIPLTEWGSCLEHDKGMHWRQGLVPPPS